MSQGTVSQDRLLAFLRDRRSYPGRPKRLEFLETHASWVILTTRRAWKVKKPVNFGFLDFSTLEKRRHFCEREVELNRRFGPGVHLGVVPISMNGDRLAFGSDGEVVEYAVQMRRLPERFFLQRMIARGGLGPRDVDAVVTALAKFYRSQKSTPAIAAWGRIAKLRISTGENFRQTQPFIGVTISRAAFEAIRLYTNGFYRRHAPLFVARVQQGWIRDCHGDLHLEHIHLGPSGPTIYDCIEFNDRFRYIDIASDAAFLAMDFDFHDRPDLSRRFAARMAEMLGDRGMPRLLDFYKCYRAYVRGKVESFHHIAPGDPHRDRLEIRRRAECYFRLSLRYAVAGSGSMVLVVMGRVGSGKSTLARALSRDLDWPLHSSDRVRKELAGVPLFARGTAPERRRLYAQGVTAKTYARLTRHAVEAVRRQRGVILDATFFSRRHREKLRKTLERIGARFCFIETRASTAAIRRRLGRRSESAGEISDARIEDFPALDRAYEPPSELPPAQFLAVTTAGEPRAAVAAVLKALAGRHARME